MGAPTVKSQKGFALVASLVMLVVLSAMGLGAMFLTHMNLRITENSRTGTMARYNAEAGLDTAFVLLSNAFMQDLELPASRAEFLTTFPYFNSSQYQLTNDGYTVFADGSVRLRVIGYGPNNARHTAEALVQPQVEPVESPGGYTLFGEGFVAKDSITLNGNGSYDINFWSGGNISIHPGTLVGGRTASAAGNQCKMGKDSEGTCSTHQPPPNVELPSFDGLRNQIIASVTEDNPSFSLANCDYRTGYYSGSNAVICVPAGGSLTITGNVTNLVVIGDATTTVNIDARTGSTSEPLVRGIIVVSRTLSFGSNAVFYGENTLVAKNDLSFGKNVISQDGTARTFIVTEGNFTLNGTGATSMYASFWVGGKFEINGTPNEFRGTVVANETIIRNGGGSFHTISTPVALDNDFIPTDPNPVYIAAGIKVLSRR